MDEENDRYRPSIIAYSSAKGFVQSAYLIVTNRLRLTTNDDTSFVMSCHLLFGFGLELYLKSYLKASGVNDKILMDYNIRHNLKNC